MAVMDACRNAGVTKIGLAAQQGGGADNAADNASGSAP